MSDGGEDIEDLLEHIKWWYLWLRKQTEQSNATYKLQIDISELYKGHHGGEDIEDLVENIQWQYLWLRKQTEKRNATYKLQIDIGEMQCSIKGTVFGPT